MYKRHVYKLVDKLSLHMFAAEMIHWNDLVSCLVMSWIVSREQIPCSFHSAEPGYVQLSSVSLADWSLLGRLTHLLLICLVAGGGYFFLTV